MECHRPYTFIECGHYCCLRHSLTDPKDSLRPAKYRPFVLSIQFIANSCGAYGFVWPFGGDEAIDGEDKYFTSTEVIEKSIRDSRIAN